MTRLYDTADLSGVRPLVNGKPLPPGVTMNDWMRLHHSPGFYSWLNAIHGCVTGHYWRLTTRWGGAVSSGPHIGDQVKITDPAHPWFGAIGRVRDRFNNQDDYWEIDLETILPGQRSMAHESEFCRV